MNSPKEKARELVRQFWDLGSMDIIKSKQCALIAVDEIINNYEDRYKYCNSKIYWEEVKKEIEKL